MTIPLYYFIPPDTGIRKNSQPLCRTFRGRIPILNHRIYFKPVQELKAGKGTAHELIEVDDE